MNFFALSRGNTMNQKSQSIKAALHGVRTLTPNFEQLTALSEAMNGATPEQIAVAAMDYYRDLASALCDVLRLERDAAVAMAERDAGGPTLN
jgi:hypothetical protein